MDGVIVLHCEHIGWEDAYHYTGLCPHFVEIAMGEAVPEYDAEFKLEREDATGIMRGKFVGWKRV